MPVTHMPIDLLIIMLGTNDLKSRISGVATEIAGGLNVLVTSALRSAAGPGGGAPRILIMCPPPLGKLPDSAELWGFGGGEKASRQLAKYYRMVAENGGCDFLDAGELIKTSDLDGVHFEREEHHKLGKAVASKVREIFA